MLSTVKGKFFSPSKLSREWNTGIGSDRRAYDIKSSICGICMCLFEKCFLQGALEIKKLKQKAFIKL